MVSGAFLQISARRALGEFSRYPVIVRKAPADKRLYVPRSQVPVAFSAENHDSIDDIAKNTPNWTLRPGHKLVHSGPYAILRHPMYSATLLTVVGSALFFCAPGSLFRTLLDASPLNTPITSTLSVPIPRLRDITWLDAAAVPIATAALGTIVGLLRLAWLEEDALSDRFGRQWKLYRWNVRSKFIPGIY